MKTLKLHESGRRIVTSDGERFYFIGDTAWELFHALSRDEAVKYLTVRKSQGFNMIQAVVLAELDGLATPNYYGRCPLKQNADGNYDPTLPDLDGEYSYFDHCEYIISLAESIGLYIGLLPTWGDKWNKKWGKGPEIFTPDNAYTYGKWLAERMKHHDNIVWILGGDRPLEEARHYEIIDSMARGLRDGDGGKFLKTLHPSGASSSSAYVHDREWLDFNMMQSGHGFPSPTCFDMMAADYAKNPIKPVMDGEQCYEDHPINFNQKNGYFDEVDVRLAMYRNLLGGACGNTYGHHAVWQMKREPDGYCPNTYKTALHRPAAEAMYIYRGFIDDNDLTEYTPVYDIVEENAHDASYVAGMIKEGAAILYVPAGAPVKLNLARLNFTPSKLLCFEPTTGEYTRAARLMPDGRIAFRGRAGGRGQDIVVFVK